MNEKEKLLNLIKTKALKKGKFILSSGKESDYYLDLRIVTTDAEGAYLIGKILYENLKNLEFDFIGGMTLGADPIVTSYLLISYLHGNPKSAFIVRKE
ncbi:MAG: orotate phosphoribosyltransferase, partial [Candidatus Altarchaeaceae archaeon]